MAKRILISMCCAALLVAGCGDDSTTDEAVSPDIDDGGATETEPDENDTAVTSGPIDGCPAQGFVGSIGRTSADGHGPASFEGGFADQVWKDGVVAARLTEGGHYTLYASDHVYQGDARNFDTITAAPGGAVATLSLGYQAGFTAGELIDMNGNEGVTMVVIIDAGGGASASSTDARGSFTVINWSDDWICIDLDYFDEFQSVNGLISAPIVSGF